MTVPSTAGEDVSCRPLPASELITASRSAGRQPATSSRWHKIARSHLCLTGLSRAWTTRQSSARCRSALPSAPRLSSSGRGRETREWWAYDGKYSRLRAAYLRGSCSCGWRGEARYPIDWGAIEDWPHDTDTSGPEEDWDRHIEEVEARTVPIPADIEELLAQMGTRLKALASDSALAGLRAVAAVERIARRAGGDAACDIDLDETSWAEISKALGLRGRFAG